MTPDKRFELTHPFRAIYWRARIVVLALRWVPRLNLGDVVIYGGREWILHQGVSRPLWEVVRGDHQDGTFEHAKAHEGDLRKKPSIANYLRSFLSGWRFYRTSWYSIWMREGIKPWMLACNIWARGRPRIGRPH